jgi:hypothetical protein
MMLRIVALAALATAAAPLAPAHAEFFTLDEMRSMCRGETAETAEFRTGAGHRLLAETHRARCRMYLLGQVDGYLQARGEPQDRARCLGAAASQGQVADAIVEALLTRTEEPVGGLGALVRDVLRTRFGCA